MDIKDIEELLDKVGIPGLQATAVIDAVNELVKETCNAECDCCESLHPDEVNIDGWNMTVGDIEMMLVNIGLPRDDVLKVVTAVGAHLVDECQEQCDQCTIKHPDYDEYDENGNPVNEDIDETGYL